MAPAAALAGLTVGGFAVLVGGTAILTQRAPSEADFTLSSGPPAAGASAVPTDDDVTTAEADQPSPAQRGGTPQRAYRAWAAGMSARTAIPARALSAYAVAAGRADAGSPACRIDWATLAAIGYVESRSGELGGGLRPSGVPRRAIYGVPLDGSGAVAAVADSDGGRWDGDPTIDRAVGPMQFLPSSWSRWSADGDGDGVPNPQDIDDAALAAARYLCAAGDLRTAAGWTAAVLSYNDSADYLADVFAATEMIAAQSRRAKD